MDDRPLRTPAWRRYLRFWGARVVDDLDDELRFHYDMRMSDYLNRGMSPDEAHRVTLARLGDLNAARDECLTIGERRTSHMARKEWIDGFTQDWRFALRTLARQPGWTGVALLTLALGIGATTAVFSVVDNLILHPIDYPHANRIVLVSRTTTSANTTGIDVRISIDPALLRAWRSASHTIEGVEGYASTDLSMDLRSGPPVEIHAVRVTTGFPALAGRQAIVGRIFNEGDATTGHVAMLGEGMWRTRLGADPGVLGRAIRLNDSLYTIIGVLPASLEVPESGGAAPEVWIPIDLSQRSTGFFGLARLLPGVSAEAARHDLDLIAARSSGETSSMKYATVVAPPSSARGRFRDSLWMLLGAVALVLLIACANVAHLLLARTTSRRRELAIRAALGAGSGRLLRQLLTEGAMLAVVAALVGVVVAWTSLHALLSVRPRALSQLAQAHVDGAALALTTAICALVTVVFGLIGARQARGQSGADALRSTTTSASRGDSTLRATLVVTEMALATMLLVGAGLLVRSVAHLQQLDLGFDAKRLYAVKVSLPPARDTTGAERRAFFAEAARRIRAVSGTVDVTLASAPPTWFQFMLGALQAEGQPDPPAGTSSLINSNGVASDYFRVLRIKMVEGTTFADTTPKSDEIVVNEGLARRFWPGQSALGRRLRIVYEGKGDWKRVVGVASNTLTAGLTADATKPLIYAPIEVSGTLDAAKLLVRVVPEASRPLATIRGIIHSLDPHLPAPDIQQVDAAMAATVALPRFTMMLLASFTVLAVLLSAVGLYGVLAYSVARRSREIGIRVALGASPARVARLVLTQALVLAAIGSAVGLLAAHRAARLIASMLYGVTANDMWSFAVAAAALVATAVGAALVPTRRALRVDPLTAIRAE